MQLNDNKPMSIANSQARIKQLTNELLSGMSKDELLLIIGEMNAEDWFKTINTGKSNTGNVTVAEFMTKFKTDVDTILSDEYHRNLDSDMFDITIG